MSEVQKKRIVKKKVVKTTPVGETQQDLPVVEELSNKFIIPSSRIRNYISGVKLNKVLDLSAEAIKNGSPVSDHLSEKDLSSLAEKLSIHSDENAQLQKIIDSVSAGVELTSVLSEDYQKKVGEALKKKEEKNAILPDGEKQVIDIKEVAVEVLSKFLVTDATIAVDMLSKHRAKFSKSSFDVLSAFSDLMIEEITKFAMDDLVASKKSIINIKYVFTDAIKNGDLYGFYSKLPTFVSTFSSLNAEQEQDETVVTDDQPVVEQPEQVEQPEETDEKKINFEFYIKSICNKVKQSNEIFAKVKVSERYQKFCSSLVLDLLDLITPLSQIVLDVMSTKTITKDLFLTCIKSQIFQSDSYQTVVDELNKRLV